MVPQVAKDLQAEETVSQVATGPQVAKEPQVATGDHLWQRENLRGWEQTSQVKNKVLTCLWKLSKVCQSGAQ